MLRFYSNCVCKPRCVHGAFTYTYIGVHVIAIEKKRPSAFTSNEKCNMKYKHSVACTHQKHHAIKLMYIHKYKYSWWVGKIIYMTCHSWLCSSGDFTFQGRNGRNTHERTDSWVGIRLHITTHVVSTLLQNYCVMRHLVLLWGSESSEFLKFRAALNASFEPSLLPGITTNGSYMLGVNSDSKEGLAGVGSQCVPLLLYDITWMIMDLWYWMVDLQLSWRRKEPNYRFLKKRK